LRLPAVGTRSLKEIDDEGSQMTAEVKNTDDAKGRLKEAAGSLTGDEELKREGRVDKASGDVKDGVEKVADKIKGVLGRDKD
jgi:uncharacterized protein YjbJ (UPF0337 family)